MGLMCRKQILFRESDRLFVERISSTRERNDIITGDFSLLLSNTAATFFNAV